MQTLLFFSEHYAINFKIADLVLEHILTLAW